MQPHQRPVAHLTKPAPARSALPEAHVGCVVPRRHHRSTAGTGFVVTHLSLTLSPRTLARLRLSVWVIVALEFAVTRRDTRTAYHTIRRRPPPPMRDRHIG